MKKSIALYRDDKANAFIELGLTLPIVTVMLFGVITGALVFDRYMTVVQLGRNAASMMSRGTDFSVEANKALVLTGQTLDMTTNGGSGVMYLTRVKPAAEGTTNAGEIVIAERHIIGNPQFRASVVGEPSSAIWPHPDRPSPNGDVKNYNEERSAVANVSGALATLPPSESMVVVEVYHSAESLRFGRAWRDPMTISTIIYF